MKNSGASAERRADGLPKGAPFQPGQSGNPDGRPKGTLSLDTRVRRLLEGDEKLPEAIAETIRKSVGSDNHALDAVIIVGLLQALQGDEKWAKLLWERGYGKVDESIRLTGKDGGPIKQEIMASPETLAAAMRLFKGQLG